MKAGGTNGTKGGRMEGRNETSKQARGKFLCKMKGAKNDKN